MARGKAVSKQRGRATRCAAVLVFSELNIYFFGYFHPENIFIDNVNE